MRWADQKGQTSTEYTVLVSVVVVAIVASAYTFVPRFQSGVQLLGSDARSILDTGTVGGIGLSRASSSGPSIETAPAPGRNIYRDGGGIGHLPKADDPLGRGCTTDHC